jgi:hypothetical protein
MCVLRTWRCTSCNIIWKYNCDWKWAVNAQTSCTRTSTIWKTTITDANWRTARKLSRVINARQTSSITWRLTKNCTMNTNWRSAEEREIIARQQLDHKRKAELKITEHFSIRNTAKLASTHPRQKQFAARFTCHLFVHWHETYTRLPPNAKRKFVI